MRARRSFDAGYEVDYGAVAIPGDPGYVDGAGRRWKTDFWKRAADHCREHRADPRQLVRACFARVKLETSPYVTTLLAPATLAIYEDFKREAWRRRAGELESYDSAYANAVCELKHADRLDERTARRRALRDRTLPVTPLYRYCQAKALGFEDLAEAWYRDALDIYLSDFVALTRNWGGRVPHELRDAARAVLGEVFDVEAG